MHSTSAVSLEGANSGTSVGSVAICVFSSHHVLAPLQLEELQKARAKNPVIPFSSEEFERFSSGGTRPYSLLIFFNAPKLKEAKALKLKEHLDKFTHLAKIVKKKASKEPSHAANSVFFVEIDMEHSRDVFARFGINNLPWIVHIGKKESRQYAATHSAPSRADALSGPHRLHQPQPLCSGAHLPELTKLLPGI